MSVVIIGPRVTVAAVLVVMVVVSVMVFALTVLIIVRVRVDHHLAVLAVHLALEACGPETWFAVRPHVFPEKNIRLWGDWSSDVGDVMK